MHARCRGTLHTVVELRCEPHHLQLRLQACPIAVHTMQMVSTLGVSQSHTQRSARRHHTCGSVFKDAHLARGPDRHCLCSTQVSLLYQRTKGLAHWQDPGVLTSKKVSRLSSSMLWTQVSPSRTTSLAWVTLKSFCRPARRQPDRGSHAPLPAHLRSAWTPLCVCPKQAAGGLERQAAKVQCTIKERGNGFGVRGLLI